MNRALPPTILLPALCALIAAIATITLAADERTEAAGAKVDAKALVERVINDENQIEKIHSLHLRMKGKWTHSPESIAEVRQKLKQQYPDREPSEKESFELRPEMAEELELVFSPDRLRYCSRWENACTTLRIWDGKQAIEHTKYDANGQESYVIGSQPELFFADRFWNDLSWPRAAPHKFWWEKNAISDENVHFRFGTPADFVVVGERNYRGTPCIELKNSKSSTPRLYIGVHDKRLHGIMHLMLPPPAEMLIAMSKLAGREFRNEREADDWATKQPPEANQAAYDALLAEFGRPNIEHFLDDYRELAPGFWFPCKQGYRFYFVKTSKLPSTTREFELVDAKINQPLADELFKIEPPAEGADVTDRRRDPPLCYKQKADRTREQWNELLEKYQRDIEVERKEQATRDAIIGKPAPDFPESQWLNSEPQTWQSLKGKIVILHFWAHWCGPCHNELPILAGSNENAARQNIVVIGIHTPGSDLADIEADIKKNKLSYPILIDARRAPDEETWGKFSQQLGVNSIPHSYLIDADSKVVAEGSLSEVIQKAFQLAKTKK